MPDDTLFDDELAGGSGGSSWLRMAGLPIGALVVVVAILCALVLGGVVQGNEARSGPERSPSTTPTVEILP